MNEQIKTLAKAAGYDEISKCMIKLTGFDMEKFAELIVRECANVPTLMWLTNEANADVAVKIRNRILDNFGVDDERTD